MDRRSLERITYSHYNPKRGGHVYDVTGTAVFISSLDIQKMPPDVGYQAQLGDELLRRAKEQRKKERMASQTLTIPIPATDVDLARPLGGPTTRPEPNFPTEGDNFVKLGKIAEEIVAQAAEVKQGRPSLRGVIEKTYARLKERHDSYAAEDCASESRRVRYGLCCGYSVEVDYDMPPGTHRVWYDATDDQVVVTARTQELARAHCQRMRDAAYEAIKHERPSLQASDVERLRDMARDAQAHSSAPVFGPAQGVQIKEFPAPALDHRHMHGGLFVKPRGS